MSTLLAFLLSLSCLYALVDAAVVREPCTVPDTEEVLNAEWMGRRKTYPIGRTVPYRCAMGYIPSGGSRPSATCVGGDEWTFRNKDSCQLLSCGYPPDIDNGNYDSDGDFRVGRRVTYHCKPGYNLEGSYAAMCMADGDWRTVDTPVCRAKECAIPETIDHGELADIYVSNHDDYKEASALLVCDRLFTAQGEIDLHRKIARRCVNGEWDGKLACQDIPCSLDEPEKGHIIIIGLDIDSFLGDIEYWCDNGYTLEGAEYNTCLKDGSWKYSLPQCKPIKCEIPKKDYLKTNTTEQHVNFNTLIRFSCEKGYSLSGVNETTCSADGRWETQIPTCLRMCELEEHENTVYCNEQNIPITASYVEGGTLVVVDCEKDYYTKGKYFMATCVGGVWKGTDSNGQMSDTTYSELFYCHTKSLWDKFTDWVRG